MLIHKRPKKIVVKAEKLTLARIKCQSATTPQAKAVKPAEVNSGDPWLGPSRRRPPRDFHFPL